MIVSFILFPSGGAFIFWLLALIICSIMGNCGGTNKEAWFQSCMNSSSLNVTDMNGMNTFTMNSTEMAIKNGCIYTGLTPPQIGAIVGAVIGICIGIYDYCKGREMRKHQTDYDNEAVGGV